MLQRILWYLYLNEGLSFQLNIRVFVSYSTGRLQYRLSIKQLS